MLNNIQYYHKLKQNAPSFINAIKLHYITKLTNLIIKRSTWLNIYVLQNLRDNIMFIIITLYVMVPVSLFVIVIVPTISLPSFWNVIVSTGVTWSISPEEINLFYIKTLVYKYVILIYDVCNIPSVSCHTKKIINLKVKMGMDGYRHHKHCYSLGAAIYYISNMLKGIQ